MSQKVRIVMYRPSFREVSGEKQLRGSEAQGMEFDRAAAGVTALTASFLERVWVSVVQTDAESSRSVFNVVCHVLTK